MRSNNFLCTSASIFMFITLIVSTKARHLNTWWAQTLVKTLVCLCYWHILQLGFVCSLILFTISHGNFSVHFSTCSCLHDYRNRLLFSVHFQINYFIYIINGNIGTVSHRIFKTLLKVDLAISFASDVVFCGWKFLRIAIFCVYLDTVPFHRPRDTILKQWSFKHAC